MPVSKRVKKVTLSKASKKASETKQTEVQQLRTFFEEDVYGLSFGGRSTQFKALRQKFKMFMGKKSIMKRALQEEGLTFVDVDALLATSEPRESIEAALTGEPEFAVAGFVPDTHQTIEAGPLSFPTSMADQLRKLGLNLEIKDGLHLLENKVLATPGTPLTAEQAKLLKLFDLKLDTFRPTITHVWPSS